MPIPTRMMAPSSAGVPEPSGWSPLQRRLHWLVAVLLALQALLAIRMHDAASALAAVQAGTAAPGALDWAVTTLHSANGVALGLLVLWRLSLRSQRRAHAPRRALLVRLHHALLYALLLLMVGSGALFWFAGIEAAGRWHRGGKWLLAVAVLVHLAGAAWHLARGDTVFRGMAGRSSSR